MPSRPAPVKEEPAGPCLPGRIAKAAVLCRPMEYDPLPMESRPTARAPRITLVLGICAVLGAIGFSLGLGMVLSWREPIPEAGLPAFFPEAPPGEEAAWEEIKAIFERLGRVQEEVMRRARPVLNALGAVNVVASAGLFAGALAARLRTASGLQLLRTGLVLSQAYAFLAVLVHGWVQLQLYGAYRTGFAEQLQQTGTVREFALAALVSHVLVAMLWAGFFLAQLVFYGWAHRWTKRPAVQAALAPLPRD